MRCRIPAGQTGIFAKQKHNAAGGPREFAWGGLHSIGGDMNPMLGSPSRASQGLLFAVLAALLLGLMAPAGDGREELATPVVDEPSPTPVPGNGLTIEASCPTDIDLTTVNTFDIDVAVTFPSNTSYRNLNVGGSRELRRRPELCPRVSNTWKRAPMPVDWSPGRWKFHLRSESLLRDDRIQRMVDGQWIELSETLMCGLVPEPTPTPTPEPTATPTPTPSPTPRQPHRQHRPRRRPHRQRRSQRPRRPLLPLHPQRQRQRLLPLHPQPGPPPFPTPTPSPTPEPTAAPTTGNAVVILTTETAGTFLIRPRSALVRSASHSNRPPWPHVPSSPPADRRPPSASLRPVPTRSRSATSRHTKARQAAFRSRPGKRQPSPSPCVSSRPPKPRSRPRPPSLRRPHRPRLPQLPRRPR